jgi:hypothetical protein
LGSFAALFVAGSARAQCGSLGNCGFENDLVHSQWTATKPSTNYRLAAPEVNADVVPTGALNPLTAPVGSNFVGIQNPSDQDIAGKLAHDAVAGSFPAGTKFTVKVWGNRGRIDGAGPTFPTTGSQSRLQLQFYGWNAGSAPTVNPASDNWSRRPTFRSKQKFTAFGENGAWATQTFVITTTKDLAYFSVSLAGINKRADSYLAFDIESFTVQ